MGDGKWEMGNVRWEMGNVRWKAIPFLLLGKSGGLDLHNMSNIACFASR